MWELRFRYIEFNKSIVIICFILSSKSSFLIASKEILTMEKSEYFEEAKECLQQQEFNELGHAMNNLLKLSFNETTLYFDGWDSFWEAISSWTTNDLKDTLHWIDNFRIKLEGKIGVKKMKVSWIVKINYLLKKNSSFR